ncbi:MAG: BON domain-containing protein [Acidobacteriota bacterium]
MRFLKSFLILSVVAILGFSSLNVQARSFSDDGNSSQTPIERKVFKEILTMPYYGLFDNISFKVDGSTVTLYGKVRNAINKSDAENYVKDIKGVTNVVNNIEILPLSSFDDSIRYQLVREFSRSGGAFYRYLQGTNPSVRIIVDNGHVSLEGYVANRSDANLANILANGVPGVFSVDNNLVVEKGKIR